MSAEEDQVDFSKLPLDERIVHKNWKARLSAYEELVKTFGRLDDKAPEWSKFGPYIRKVPLDTNAAAAEKGLEAVLLFLENSASAPKLVVEVVSGLIAKCITASRTKTKELSWSIILMGIEIEKYEAVLEELMKGMEHKNPKVVAACISIMTQSIREFGIKILNLKAILKKLPPFFDDRDKTVRDETKKLTVELYRWIGAALRPQLSSLKPVVLQELEAEFEKNQDKPVQTRFLRSQQARREAARQSNGGEEEEEVVEEEAVPEIDPYELMEPVDILSKLPKDFYEKTEAKKWQERKEAMEALEALTSSPKLEPGDYSDLVRCLKRLISKDNNVLVVALAGKCIAGLANGLKKKFSPYAASCISGILEKFKEKKSNVVTAMREAADACYPVTSLETIQEDAIAALGNKNPAVKSETTAFLARAFSKTQYKTMTDKKLMKPYYTALINNLNESDLGVRDASCEALGVAMKNTGEKFMDPFLADVDPLKLAKIKESCEKAVITVKRTKEPSAKPAKESSASRPASREAPKASGKPGSGSSKISSASAPKKAPTKAAPLKKPQNYENCEYEEEVSNGYKPPTKDSPPGNKPGSKLGRPAPKGRVSPGKKSVDDPIGTNLQVNALKAQRFTDENKLKVLRWTFTSPREEFIELLKDQMTTANLGRGLMEKMFHIDFKLHLKAIDILSDEMQQDIEGTISNLDLILKWLSIRFFDTNPSVLIRSLEYLSTLFRILGTYSYNMVENEANCFIPYLLLKVGEPKDTVRLNVHNILRLIYNCYPPAKVHPFILEGLKGKNARQRAECLDELSYMVTTFTISIFSPPSAVMKEVARQISDRDQSVRNAALNCVVAVYFQEGDKVYKMIGNLSDKDQSLLDERIKRAGKSRPPTGSLGVGSAKINPSIAPTANIVKPPPAVVVPPKTAPPSQQQYAQLNNTNINLNNNNNNLYTRPSPETLKYEPSTATRPVPVDSPPSRYPIPEDFRAIMEDIERRYEPKEVGGGPMSPLKLYDTNTDFLDNEVPVSLPPRRYSFGSENNKGNQYLGGGESVLTDESGSVQSIDLVVAQVGSNDLVQSMEATVKLEALISDPEVSNVMAIRVELLLTMVAMQLRKLLALLDGPDSPPVDLAEINQLYRCIIQLIHTLYKNAFLSTKASTEVLKDMILQLLILIVDPKLKKIPDAVFITKQINVMVVRIIEKSDPNSIIIGLIKLMNDAIQLNVEDNLLELVLKCLWKLLKQFSTWSEELKNYEYDIDGILKELSNFMKVHNYTTFVKDKDITPMKTMKTILHAIVPLVDPLVLSKKLNNFPDLKNSDPGHYLQKLLVREMERNKVAPSPESLRAPRCHLTTTTD